MKVEQVDFVSVPTRDVRRAVLDLWAATTADGMDRCQRMYVEAAALGLLGSEPYASVVREANSRWMSALADHLLAAGVPRPRVARAATLLEACFQGLQLDLPRTAKTIRNGGLVTDGPYAETKEQLGGFFLAELPDLDEAIRLAGLVPAAEYGSMEIRPLVEH